MQKLKREFEILYEENLLFKKNINSGKTKLLIITNIKNINYIRSALISNANEIIINKFYSTGLRKFLEPTDRGL